MRIKRGLAALLALLMLLALPPTALMEEEIILQDAAEDWAEEAEADLAEDWAVEPEVGLAEDAGDTGLTVEFEDAPYADEAFGDALSDEVELSADDAADAADEAPDDIAVEALETGDEEGALEIEAVPVISTGYAAVAPETPVYVDAERTQAVGVFPDGAVVVVEAVEADGALLKIRYDTEDSRSWAEDIPAGYVLAMDALAYTDEEAAALAGQLSADSRTRYVDDMAVPCVNFTAVDFAVMAAGESAVGLNVASHTQAEIQAFINAHPAYRNQVDIYKVAAKDEPFAPGKLSDVNQRSALNLLNQIRYIAGVNSNVGLLTEQEDTVAAAALVLRLYSAQYKAQNGKDILTHYPPRAAAISDSSYDSLYSLGYTGASRSNIAMGYTVSSAMLAYMSDSDDTNIKTVGHRRWMLNPTMGKTVFGANGRFSAMYAHDLSGAGGQSKVAWPAQQMPLQYFNANDPWSVSYGRSLTANQITVTLVRVRDGKTWSFSSSGADGDFYVENNAYGQRGCVIFRPSGLGSIAQGDTFNVSINDGAAGELTRYTVRFFSASLTACDPLALPDKVTAIKTASGNELSWSAVSGAQGYYVCRKATSDAYAQIVADVSATSYRDTAVSVDKDYYYQIYAHDASRTSRSAVNVLAQPIPPTSVALSASGTVKVYRNKTLQLSVSYAPANAMPKGLTWKSSKKKIATVDANGLVKPLKAGTTVISVTTDNGRSASVKVKVLNVPKAKKVKLSASGTKKLNIGETLQLSGTVTPAAASQKLKWKSSKKKVASVSGSGLVTALKAGTATITAKTSNGKYARVKIKVIDPCAPTSVTLNYTGTKTLHVKETLTLQPTLNPVGIAKSKITYSSSNKKVATVNRSGVITAKKKGTATITVKTANGKKAKLKIKVVK